MRDITSHQDVEEPALQGEHEEKGVLIVESDTKTLDHHDEKDMYFVYDKKRDRDFVKQLVEKMNIPQLSEEVYLMALDKQTDATVGILAAGKPILEVNLVNEEPAVTYIATVPLVV